MDEHLKSMREELDAAEDRLNDAETKVVLDRSGVDSDDDSIEIIPGNVYLVLSPGQESSTGGLAIVTTGQENPYLVQMALGITYLIDTEQELVMEAGESFMDRFDAENGEAPFESDDDPHFDINIGDPGSAGDRA